MEFGKLVRCFNDREFKALRSQYLMLGGITFKEVHWRSEYFSLCDLRQKLMNSKMPW